MFFWRKPKKDTNPKTDNLAPLPTPVETKKPNEAITESFDTRNLDENISNWKIIDVGQWLTLNNFDQYRVLFLENKISGLELIELVETDLEKMGVKKLGDRKKLLKEIKSLKKARLGVHSESIEDSHSYSNSMSSAVSSNSSGSSSRTELSIKCFLPGDEIRCVDIKPCTSFADLTASLWKELGQEYVAKYKDKDGDLILMKTDKDIKRANNDGSMKLWLSKRQVLDGKKIELYDTMTNGIVLIDRHGVVLYTNPALLKMFGFEESIIGRNVTCLMNQDDADNHNRYMKNYLDTGFARIIGKGRVVKAKRVDGTEFGVRLTVSEVKDDSGEIVYFSGTIHEISDQSALSWEAIVSNWSVFDSSLDPFIVINDRGIILFFNKSAEKIWGYSRSQVMNTNVKLLMPQPFRGEHDTYLSNYNRSGVSRIMNTGRDVPIQKADGTVIRSHLKLTQQVIQNMTFYIGTFQDPVHTKTLTLLEQERQVINSLLIPAIIINSKGSIQGWNQGAEMTFGYSAAEVIGQNIKLLMGGKDKENHDSYLEQYQQTGQSKIIGRGRKVFAIQRDGTKIPCNLWVSEKTEDGVKVFTGVVQPIEK